MISYEEALQIVQDAISPLGETVLPLDLALGAVLSKPVVAPFDIPLFDNSAVDGYGIRVEDVPGASSEAPVSLTLAGKVPAGHLQAEAFEAGTSVQILTGAPVPPGVDAVVMQEYTAVQDGVVVFRRGANLGENIRLRGEEFSQGSVVMPAGTPLNPAGIGMLSTLGLTKVSAYRKPKVALVITGNELIPPGQPLEPGKIYESNTVTLKAALALLGLTDISVFTVQDDSEATQAILRQAMDYADVTISSGGVSVGEFDFVKEGFLSLGIQPHFWKVAIKPGKPVFFGTSPGKVVFGLPGNPVAVLLTFHFLVRPALLKMMGYTPAPPLPIQARLAKTLKKRPGRMEWVRGHLSADHLGEYTVTPTLGQGSHMLGGLATANAIIVFPENDALLPEGSVVLVYPLHWGIC